MHKQPLINELKYFVTTVSNYYRLKPDEINLKLVRTSLTLLEDLPAAREAVFEYFSIVFDLSVKNYVRFLDKKPFGTPPDEDAITDIQETLENLVKKSPDAWAPLISTWSLRLLGRLSSEHTPRRQFDIESTCKFWLGSNAIRCLMGLTALCFQNLSDENTEACITVLLNIFIQYHPNYDWVVARLGSCFPLKVISKILQCGLKGFVGNSAITLDSEIGILGYLAYAHEKDLKQAIHEMFEAALKTSPKQKDVLLNPNTIPYLINLCRKSDILLQPITSLFLEIFNENETSISNLYYQIKFWPQSYTSRDLLSVLTNLSTKINQNGTNIMLKLSSIAEKYKWCHELLENILYELESFNLTRKTCPLFQDILKNDSKHCLWKSCCSSKQIEHSTAVRLILLVSSSKNQLIYHQTIAELLSKPSYSNKNALGCLIRLLGGSNGNVDIPSIEFGLELALEKFFMVDKRRQNETDNIGYNIINNLVNIVRLEKKGSCPNLKRNPISKSCIKCIGKLLSIFKLLMDRVTKTLHSDRSYMESENQPKSIPTQPSIKFEKSNESTSKKIKMDVEEGMIIDDDEDEGEINDEEEEPKKIDDIVKSQIHMLVKLLDNLVLINRDGASVLETASVLKLSKLVVKYFFWNLTERNTVTRLLAMAHVNSILGQQCQNKGAKAVALIDLLEGSLFTYCNLFGMHVESESKNMKDDRFLMLHNQKLGKSPNSNRAILHAGVIGTGLRRPAPKIKLPDTEIQNLLLSAITACCRDDDWVKVVENFSLVSLFLVKMVSPDVMYNGLPWLEDEFLKVTMERDLQIQRTFHSSPVLWAILEHVATHRPALCVTSVLFRALCASVLHKWQAKSVEKTSSLLNSELMFTTVKLLEIMSLGQFLAPPLSYFHFIIEYFDPNEISIVLKECIWSYMKDNVPSPIPFARDASGFQWREPERSKIRKDEILRNMMERKLPQLGHYYYIMFVLPEQYEIQLVSLHPPPPATPQSVEENSNSNSNETNIN